MNRKRAVDHRAADGSVRDRLLAALPVGERSLDLAGISTAILEGGDGPPLVLLHGAGEFAAVWGRVIPDLVRDRRVVVPDLPGHGATGIPDGPLDASRVLGWLDELIERTCPSPPVLAGHLLGGSIAARFALERPDRVGRLVLVDSLGLGRYRPSPKFAIPLLRFIVRPTERTQERMMRQCFVDFDGLRAQMGTQLRLLEAYALELARTPGTKRALRALMKHLGTPIPPKDLARIAVPVTLIWGRHDLQVRVRIAEAASAGFGWALHVIGGARDDPAFEQPEAFMRVLCASLDTSTGE